MNQVKIGKFISECRKNINLTQEQLAEKLGVTSKSISRWENGKTIPDYSLLESLCKILNVNMLELLKGEKENKDDALIKDLVNFIVTKKIINKILSTLIFIFVIIIFYIIYNVKRFQGFNNDYLFQLYNHFNIIPFSNIISLFYGTGIGWFIKNLIINSVIGIIIFIWIFSLTSNKNYVLILSIVINLIFELSKWLLLIGMFDINDIIIRLIFTYIFYILHQKKILKFFINSSITSW